MRLHLLAAAAIAGIPHHMAVTYELDVSMARPKPTMRLRRCAAYDWSSAVTDFAQWLGGHSRFSPWKGNPEDVIRYLLSEDSGDSGISSHKIQPVVNNTNRIRVQ